MTRFFTGSRLVGFDPPKLGPDRWDCPALWVGLIRWDLLPLNWSQVGGTEQSAHSYVIRSTLWLLTSTLPQIVRQPQLG